MTIHPIIQVSKDFISAVAQGTDVSELATNSISEKINRAENPSKIQNIDIYVQSFSKRWARCKMCVEIVLPDGSPDVGWYELELVKDNLWLVNKIGKISPTATGRSGYIKQADIDEINNAFSDYLRAIQIADYQKSIKYLAGPAREIHAEYQQQLGQEPLVKEFKSITSKLLWTDGIYAVIEVNYTVDNRKANVQAGFYKTQQGWRMVNI